MNIQCCIRMIYKQQLLRMLQEIAAMQEALASLLGEKRDLPTEDEKQEARESRGRLGRVLSCTRGCAYSIAVFLLQWIVRLYYH